MPDTTTSTTKKKLTLRDFQKEDVAYMKQNNYRVLVANGQGTGKTIECLAAIAIDRQMLCPVIIVCPASVLWNWCKEARKWCKWARIHPVTNKIEPLPRRTAHIYVVSWALLTERAAELASIGHRLLIADEAHFAKNDEAMRSKVLKALANRSKHLLLLT
jgi:SNF2 family DNA or RNA helicase